jgi:hypothetical protein
MSNDLTRNALIRMPCVPTLDVMSRVVALAERRGLSLEAATEQEAIRKARAAVVLAREHVTTAPTFAPGERLETFETLLRGSPAMRDAAIALQREDPAAIVSARKMRDEERQANEDRRRELFGEASRLENRAAELRRQITASKTRVHTLERAPLGPQRFGEGAPDPAWLESEAAREKAKATELRGELEPAAAAAAQAREAAAKVGQP